MERPLSLPTDDIRISVAEWHCGNGSLLLDGHIYLLEAHITSDDNVDLTQFFLLSFRPPYIKNIG